MTRRALGHSNAINAARGPVCGMDNLEAVLAGGPPRDDELALRPSKRTCHDWQLALRNRKVTMLFTLLRLVRKGAAAWATASAGAHAPADGSGPSKVGH